LSKSSQKRARKRVDFLLDLYRTKPDRFCLEINRRIQGWLHVAVRCWERPTTSTRGATSFEDVVTRLERDIATLADAEEDLKGLMSLGPLLRSEATHARARVLDPRLYKVTVNLQRPVRR
jgi:hypothetical protein